MNDPERVFEHCAVPSRYNVSVPISKTKVAVYNTFTGSVVVMSREIFSRTLSEGSRIPVRGRETESTVSDIYRRGLLVQEGIDELALVRQHYQGSRYEDFPRATIAPTMECNLSCPYCFAGEARHTCRRKHMSDDTLDAVLAYLARFVRGANRFHIRWFGGEPLLAAPIVERVSGRVQSACREIGTRYTSSLISNGILMTEEWAVKLQEAGIVYAQVTIDVPWHAKRDAHGGNTTESALRGVTNCIKHMKVHLRINLVDDSEDEFDAIYDFLISKGLMEHLDRISVAALCSPERGEPGCTFQPLAPNRYVTTAARETRKLKALGAPVDTLSLGAISACGATCERSVVIDHEGFLYKCDLDVGLRDRAYGTVFSNMDRRLENYLPFMEYDWFNIDECRDCVVLPQCGGGCPHERLRDHGNTDGGEHCCWKFRGGIEERIREWATQSR